MADKRVVSVEEILALVGFTTEFLPHPVSLLTIEQASNIAGVPKTTVDSAVDGTHQFRELVVACAIESLVTEPGPATWDAMRKGLREGRRDVSISEALALVLEARATELASDPAFALFLGGYDWLDTDRVARAVDVAALSLIRRFVPFVETTVAALADAGPIEVGPDQALVILHVLLTEAYRRLPGFPRPSEATESVVRSQSANLILDEFGPETARPSRGEWGSFFASVRTPVESPEGRLGAAVRAGAELLLSGAIPLSIRLTVSDVTAATGMSVAAFYRRFGSIAELERVLLDCIGTEILTCFADDFFDGLLDGVRSGGLAVGDAFALFIERGAAKVLEHIESGRPDRQTLPWMQSMFVAEVFRNAYREGYEMRGSFYEDFGALVGLRPAEGLTGADVSAVLNSHSIISELLIRNAPDRQTAAAVMHTRFPRINARLFA